MANSSTSIKLDPDIKARVQKLADSQKRTSHWLMKEAIERYVESEEKRQSRRQEAEKAWASFREDGLHLSLEEADKWLADLEAGCDVEPPACHS